VSLFQFRVVFRFNILRPVAGGKVSEVAGDATAIHPSWRRATHHFILVGGWITNTTFAERDVIREGLTNATQTLGTLVPDFGCYINEYVLPGFSALFLSYCAVADGVYRADANEPHFSDVFWGSNYPRLQSIKSAIDPQGLFTCHHCVGYTD
jgi:hypothetical protein